MAAPREGSGMCHLRGWATAQTLELGESKEKDQAPSPPAGSCQDLVCWAVIPKGHGAQAGAWERREHQALCGLSLLSMPVSPIT